MEKMLAIYLQLNSIHVFDSRFGGLATYYNQFKFDVFMCVVFVVLLLFVKMNAR